MFLEVATTFFLFGAAGILACSVFRRSCLSIQNIGKRCWFSNAHSISILFLDFYSNIHVYKNEILFASSCWHRRFVRFISLYIEDCGISFRLQEIPTIFTSGRRSPSPSSSWNFLLSSSSVSSVRLRLLLLRRRPTVVFVFYCFAVNNKSSSVIAA